MPASDEHPAPEVIGTPAVGESDRSYAMFIHLSALLGWVLGPLAAVVTLVLWLTKREQSPFVDDHGREAMNFAISIWIYSLVAGLLVMVVVGCFLLPALLIFQLIVVIMAAVQAHSGALYRYPMTIRFIPG